MKYFVRNYAETVVYPLTEDVQWEWELVHKLAFAATKQSSTTSNKQIPT